jgi:hypothetical protein
MLLVTCVFSPAWSAMSSAAAASTTPENFDTGVALLVRPMSSVMTDPPQLSSTRMSTSARVLTLRTKRSKYAVKIICDAPRSTSSTACLRPCRFASGLRPLTSVSL